LLYLVQFISLVINSFF